MKTLMCITLWIFLSIAGLALPGARMEIDAAKYDSLQQALDALPAEGGMGSKN